MRSFFLNISCCLGILFIVGSTLYAQSTRKQFPSYFGIQFKPIVPGDFLSKSSITVNDSGFVGVFNQRPSYSFGGIVRVGLSKLISLETGINQVKRNYRIDFELPDSSLQAENDLSIISYDIPITAMIYIQLSEQIFTNASLGTSLVFYPSNVGSSVIAQDKHLFIAEGRRNRQFDLEVNANLGFEWRSKKSGFYYVGISGKVPFAPIYTVAAVYEHVNASKKIGLGELSGGYLSVDLRYFFPNVANKGIQFNKGPIDQ
ncbi:MAG: hypothetical protein EP338_11535 [Bacteroidetes bacterium]|nr:MAG: hypothetical protein EP338_11535 [Bacteroidota bacterium]